MRYSTQFVLLLAIATLLPVFAITPVAAKSSCDDATQQIPPSSKLREIKLDQYGVVFNIPANYRTTSTQNRGQHIEISSPAEFEYLECVRRNSIPTDVYSTAEVSIIPTGGKYQTVLEFAKSGLISDNFDFARLIKKTKIAGQPALIYESTHRKGLITAVFLSPDKQLGIAISTLNEEKNPVVNRIFNGILTSLKFGTKTAESQTRQTTVSGNALAQPAVGIGIPKNKPQGCIDERELKKGPVEFYIIHDPANTSTNFDAVVNIREQPTVKSPVVHVASPGNPLMIFQQVVRDNYCWLKVDVTSIKSQNDPTSYITIRGWVRGDFVIPSQNI
jgi:Bacterial SH3 domain